MKLLIAFVLAQIAFTAYGPNAREYPSRPVPAHQSVSTGRQ